MEIKHEGNVPTVQCHHCGSIIELVELYQIGNGIHCPVCVDGDISHGHVGYLHDFCGTGLEKCVIKIGG